MKKLLFGIAWIFLASNAHAAGNETSALLERMSVPAPVIADLNAMKRDASMFLKDLVLYRVKNGAKAFPAVAEAVRAQSSRTRSEYEGFCESQGFAAIEPCLRAYHSIGSGSTGTGVVNHRAYEKPADYAAGNPPVRYFDLVKLIEPYNSGSRALVFSIDYPVTRGRYESADFHFDEMSSTVLVLVSEIPAAE